MVLGDQAVGLVAKAMMGPKTLKKVAHFTKA